MYEALSYAWYVSPSYERTDKGPKLRWNSSYTILCNGIEVSIWTNLWLALRRIRYRKSSRVVWADALCIDQSNVEERNQQVLVMSSIYSRASRTLVWLGEDAQDSTVRQALEIVCQLVNQWNESRPAQYRTIYENS